MRRLIKPAASSIKIFLSVFEYRSEITPYLRYRCTGLLCYCGIMLAVGYRYTLFLRLLDGQYLLAFILYDQCFGIIYQKFLCDNAKVIKKLLYGFVYRIRIGIEKQFTVCVLPYISISYGDQSNCA